MKMGRMLNKIIIKVGNKMTRKKHEGGMVAVGTQIGTCVIVYVNLNFY